jgi:hypothetical protein
MRALNSRVGRLFRARLRVQDLINLVSVAAGHRDAHFRQALASPHSGSAIFTIRPRPLTESKMTKLFRLFSVALLGAILATGCAARGVRIAELKDQPDKYDDKTVSVTGVVTSSWGIPLVPFQLYNVDDGSGEITVISRSGRSPSRGARVEVKGKINEVGVFGGRSIGLHIQEDNRKIKS